LTDTIEVRVTALEQIKQLYYKATRATVQRDLDRAIDLLKSMKSEAERERATVYMEGLAEMRKEWKRGADER
jgi:hypothetical protein